MPYLVYAIDQWPCAAELYQIAGLPDDHRASACFCYVGDSDPAEGRVEETGVLPADEEHRFLSLVGRLGQVIYRSLGFAGSRMIFGFRVGWDVEGLAQVIAERGGTVHRIEDMELETLPKPSTPRHALGRLDADPQRWSASDWVLFARTLDPNDALRRELWGAGPGVWKRVIEGWALLGHTDRVEAIWEMGALDRTTVALLLLELFEAHKERLRRSLPPILARLLDGRQRRAPETGALLTLLRALRQKVPDCLEERYQQLQEEAGGAMAELHAAVQHAVRAGDRRGVLDSLLALWALHRSPEVEQAVTTLSAPLLRELAQQGQAEGERQESAAHLLLFTPWRDEPTLALRRRLAALETLPPDPRVMPCADEIAAILTGRGADPVAVEAALVRLEGQHGRPLADLPEIPAVTAILAEASRLRDEEEALLDAVLASPDDRSIRLVYADYLLERGEALGSYLAASLSASLSASRASDEPEVPAELKRAWCGRLLGPIDPSQVWLRDGFPFRVRLQGERCPRMDRGWATVEELDLVPPLPLPVAQLRALPRLRSVCVRPRRETAAWFFARRAELAELGLRELSLPWNAWSAACGALPWPGLEQLGLFFEREPLALGEASLGPLARRPLALHLESARLSLGTVVARVAAALPQTADGITRVTAARGQGLERPGLALSFLRGGDGRFREIRLLHLDEESVDQLAKAMSSLDPGQIDRITVEAKWVEERFVQRVRRALRRFGDCELAFRSRRGQS